MQPDFLLQVLPNLLWAVLAVSTAFVWWRSLERSPYPAMGWGDRRARRRARLRAYRAQAEAEARAEVMLRQLLGPDQFQLLSRRGFLEVQSSTYPSRVYLVPERQGPVTVCEYGRPIMRLCVQCVERVPDYDTVAMHKLMIEGNEREYLRIANRV